MAIFMTLCLSIIVNTIETTEIKTADRNIRLNESADGKYRVIPLIFSNVWFVCINIPAKAGPIAAPTILRRVPHAQRYTAKLSWCRQDNYVHSSNTS